MLCLDLAQHVFKTRLATYRSAESSIVNQSDSDRDSPREQPLASSRSEPSQSPIKSQQTDRWQVGFSDCAQKINTYLLVFVET